MKKSQLCWDFLLTNKIFIYYMKCQVYKKEKLMARDQYVLTQRTAKHQHKKQLTQAEKYKVYCNLKKRVKKKSKDAYHDNGTEPEGLRLERIGSNIDKQVVYIVQYGTFNELLNKMGKETGFECLVYVTPSKLKRLYVNFANFKMYTESKNAYVGKKPQLS
jgi:hypothetical protein